MEVEDIILKITALKSVFGEGARMCSSDQNLSKQFLMECYKEILENRNAMEDHFGKDVVEGIVAFAKNEFQ